MFSSLRSRITLWSTIVSGVAVASLVFFIYVSFIRALRSETDENLVGMATSFVTAASSEESDVETPARAFNELRETADAFKFSDYEFTVFNESGNAIVRTSEIPLAREASADLPFSSASIDGNPYRVYRRPLRMGGQNLQLAVVRPLADRIALENRLFDTVIVALPLAILIAAVGAYFLVRRSLTPIRAMSARADQITSQNLHERLTVANEVDELAHLAHAFNDLLDRLDKAFEQQRRFMADASHELRTPLAIVRGESDVALLQEDRSAAEYKESLRIVNDESKRLTKIVDDLFTLARADAGKIITTFGDVYVDEIVADCVHSVRTLAESRYIAVDLNAEELQVRGDETMLRRLFINLLDNAIKYNHYGGRISVGVHDHTVKIANTGEPIPTDVAEHIFERFYRADKPRATDRESLTGGAGLGLSIAEVIAELHHAKIEYTHLGVENIFSVTFPQ